MAPWTTLLASAMLASASVTPLQLPDIDLDHSIVFESVRDRLQYLQGIANHVQTLPPCAQLATSALLHTCSALEGSLPHDEGELKRGSDLFVDEEADIYSARLAVCELNSADFPVPEECKSFIPAERGSDKKRGIRGFWPGHQSEGPGKVYQYYEEVTQANLKQCRRALGSFPQAWTSYSNNRQNAYLYCRAVRSEIEKDDQIHVGKVLAKTAVSASESLHDAFEQFNDLKAEFSKLATAMPQFQMDLAAGNERQLEHIQQFWKELELAREGLVDIATGVNDIRKGVQYANEDIVGLGVVVGKSANEVTGSFGALRTNLADAAGDMETLSQLIAYQREKQQQEFIKGLGAITNDISVVNNLMTTHQQALYEERAATDRWLLHRIEKETEYQNLQKEMAATLVETNDRAKEVNSTLASLPSLVGLNLAPIYDAVELWAVFMAHAIVYSFLMYALWEKCVTLSFTATSFGAIGSGFGMAFFSTSVYGPLDIGRAVVSALPPLKLEDDLKLLAVGALMGMLFVLVCTTGVATFKKWRFAAHVDTVIAEQEQRFQEYDPMSPRYDPHQVRMEKWTV